MSPPGATELRVCGRRIGLIGETVRGCVLKRRWSALKRPAPANLGPKPIHRPKSSYHFGTIWVVHGVSGFPDPTASPPSDPAGYSQIQNRGGVVLAIPSTIDVESPVYQQAAAACQFGH